MMKRKLLNLAALMTAMGMMVSAQASQPRVDVLGSFNLSGTAGAYTYDDDKNVFHNPALINTYKNFVAFSDTDAMFANSLDMANISYGVSFGRNNQALGWATTAASGLATGAGFTGGTLTNDMAEIIVGGDMGVQWGASFSWVHDSASGASGDHADARQINLGVVHNNMSAWVNWTTDATYSTVTSPSGGMELDKNLEIGGKYVFNDWHLFAAYNVWEFEYGDGNWTGGGSAADNTAKSVFWQLGGGRTNELAEGFRIHYAGALQRRESEDMTNAATTSGTKFEDWIFQTRVAFEASATSWLTLRAGASYNLLNRRKTETVTTATTTDDNSGTSSIDPVAGGTLEFGRLKVDFAYQAGENNGYQFTGTDGGFINIGNVAVHYSW